MSHLAQNLSRSGSFFIHYRDWRVLDQGHNTQQWEQTKIITQKFSQERRINLRRIKNNNPPIAIMPRASSSIEYRMGKPTFSIWRNSWCRPVCRLSHLFLHFSWPSWFRALWAWHDAQPTCVESAQREVACGAPGNTLRIRNSWPGVPEGDDYRGCRDHS